MSARVFVGATLFGAAMLVGCKEQIPIPATPTTIRIVSGSNQSADLSSALDSALVVQVLDAAARPVAGVVLTWTATSGTLSAATTPTSADGRASVRWTLGSTIGTHVATVSSTQVAGVSVSFLATNGATISGVVSPAGGNPFANFSMSPSRASRMSLSSVRRITRRLSPNHVVVGFRDGALGVAASGSTAYRSLATARQTGTRMQQSVARLSRTLPIADARFSPAMLAARVRVLDTTDVERVMAELRKDADVAWVERDEIVSIRDGAPRPSSAAFLDAFANRTPGTSASMVAPRYPNDPTFYAQYWAANMIDLPKAWSITTGSPNVTVAVIDMGIRFDHADIAANLTNDGYDFVSEIGYGSTQQICGGGEFDTIDGDGDGPDADPTDPDDLAYDARFDCWERQELGDHGLWTAGIIGSVGNDAVGISGVNWGVKIRPVRVLGITGDGTNFDIAQGILYSAGLAATGAGGAPVQAPTRAQIINLSLGGPSPSNVLLSAVNAAFNAGSLVVASAGNDGLDFPNYPAAYPNVMGVSAIGQDGALATYSNAGTFISVAAPGGDFRLDGNGGGGIVGPGWNFVTGRPTFLFGYGTSAAAPYVAGVAALILAQTPTLTPSALRTRIEQFAMRPAGTTRSDTHGWGIVNAYNSITQTSGPLRKTFVRLVDPTSGNVVRTTTATLDGSFTFARVTNGAYFVQAGDDESGDNTLGIPGRRLGWYGGSGAPTAVNVNGNSQALAFSLGMPMEVEPNNDTQGANILVPGGYVVGNITTPDVRDVYRVVIATPGVYTFETTGLVGSCGMGVELDTVLLLQGQDGTNLVQNNDFTSPTSRFCSRMQPTLTAGVYYVTVTGTSGNGLALHGRYRLQVRAGS